MNKNSIVKFITKTKRGLFISVPYTTIPKECHIKDKEGLMFALMVCFGSKGSIPSWMPIVIPEADYEILGLSNRLSEDDMKKLDMAYKEYVDFLYEQDITVNYSDFSNFWLVLVEKETPNE